MEVLESASGFVRVDEAIYFPLDKPEDDRLRRMLMYGFDNPTIHARFDLAGFGAAIEHDGMLGEAERAFRLHRLHYVRQLGYLRHPAAKEKYGINHGTTLTFDHVRIEHVEKVYLMINLIIHNNPVLRPLANLLKVAAEAHDGKTPAGGDTTKLADLAWFDEEKRFGDYGYDPEVLKFCEDYNIDFKQLWDIVLGKGLGGKVLDIADKLGYTTPDIVNYFHQMMIAGPGAPALSKRRTPAEQLVIKLLTREPEPCRIWENVRVDGDGVYFELDAESRARYVAFWLLRAYNFKNLYYHPLARLPDYLLVMETVRYLLHTGELSREWLVEATDSQLDDIMMKKIRFRQPFSSVDVVDTLHFKTKMEAAAYARSILDETDDKFALVDNFQVTTKVGCDKFPVRIDGKFMEFGEAFPHELELITDLMTFPERHDVHILTSDRLEREQRQNIRQALIHATTV